MEKKEYIGQLFEKYLGNTCSPEEARTLLRLMQSAKYAPVFNDLITTYLQKQGPADERARQSIDKVFKRLALADTEKQPGVRKTRNLWFVVPAAAVVLLSLSIGLLTRSAHTGGPETNTAAHDVAPGGNKAILTMADGRTINLSSEQSGIVVRDQISYLDGSSVTSESVNTGTKPQAYTLTTPKGGTYQVTLPDGTHVWLNAASTLTYPSRFDGNERVVHLEGEAFFAVTTKHNDAHRPASPKVPFKVVSRGQYVEVLGTQFNVNSYTEEHATNTTLVEGRVKVVAENQSVELRPGQLAHTDDGGITTSQVDVETVIDWKNGDFVFADEALKSVMRKIARWYDVEVVYEEAIANERFGGQISRHRQLSEILRMLSLSGNIQFEIKEKTIYVRNAMKT